MCLHSTRSAGVNCLIRFDDIALSKRIVDHERWLGFRRIISIRDVASPYNVPVRASRSGE